MDTTTTPQQASLDNFTVQRDLLQKEVTALTLVKEARIKENKELIDANNALVDELVTNQVKVKENTNAVNNDLIAIKAQVLNEQNKLDFILQKKADILVDIDKTSSLLNVLNDAMAKAKDDTTTVLSNLVSVNIAVNDHLAVVSSSSADVSKASSDVKDMVASFTNFYTTHESDFAAKKATQDKREAQLNDRQIAIDNTYASILNDMEVKSISLSELNAIK